MGVQDAGARSAIDKQREEAEFEAFAAEELARQEKARQWRVARGEATAEDLQGPLKAGPTEREEWITVLPASRRPSAPSQKSQARCHSFRYRLNFFCQSVAAGH